MSNPEIPRPAPFPQPPAARGGGASPLVKICGIKSDVAFDAAVAARADWIGFNFFPPSPRFVTPAQAATLSARASGPLLVGLLVEPTDDDVQAALAALPLDTLQLYTSARRAAELRARFAIPVWRPVSIATCDDLPGAEPGIDGHLIEAKAPPGANRPGGNASRFDWSLTSGWQASLPWLLAGGLTPANVAEAIATSGARAVDVSSGVERTTGVKDPALIAAFVAAAKATGPAVESGEAAPP